MTTRTLSTIAAELEDAFALGKTERELLVLIRELRAAIDTTVISEALKLREAIRDAGFEVMQTSGRWSIHDVSEQAMAKQEKTAEIIGQNIDLEIKVSNLLAHLRHMIWLVEIELKEDGGHIVAGAKAAIDKATKANDVNAS
jgi:hypothetical protein